MLARVADNLFWMGRYIERAEHMARYMNVTYFSSLDAPNAQSQSREFVLRSILFMAGDPADPDEKIKERVVLEKVGMSRDYPASVRNAILYARENALKPRPHPGKRCSPVELPCFHQG